jgi:hypothetical protein
MPQKGGTGCQQPHREMPETPPSFWDPGHLTESGRRDSNPRHLAWEAKRLHHGTSLICWQHGCDGKPRTTLRTSSSREVNVGRASSLAV